MSIRFVRATIAGVFVTGMFSVAPAVAEILFLEGGNVASAELDRAYAHPSLRSIVFVSPEARQMALLPPSPVFVQPPPLLWRASPFPIYPPASAIGPLNSSTRPSNRNMTTYHLQRAHGFSQELFYRDTYLNFQIGAPTYPLAYWNYGLMPAYPPNAPGSSRPSNRDNTTYHLERAHRFSMDAYKRP